MPSRHKVLLCLMERYVLFSAVAPRAARPPGSKEAVSRPDKRPTCPSLSILSVCMISATAKSAWDPPQGKMCSPPSFFSFYGNLCGCRAVNCARRARSAASAVGSAWLARLWRYWCRYNMASPMLAALSSIPSDALTFSGRPIGEEVRTSRSQFALQVHR